MRKYADIIHKICKRYRQSLGYTLNDVASDTGYVFTNIEAFEHGRNRNFHILLWYIDKGLNEEFCEKTVKEGKII